MQSLLLLLLLSAVHQTHSCGIHHDANHSHNAPDPEVVLRRNLVLRAENNKRPRPSPKVALTNVQVFDGWNLLPPQTIVIENGLISHPHALEIDGTGHTLLPGLIDSHAHHAPALPHGRRLWSPRVWSLGFAGPFAGIGTAVADAEGWVEDQIEKGAEFVKMIAETPGLSQEVLSATAAAARAKGKVTVCHASDYGSVQQALVADVGQVHHVPLDRPLNDISAQTFLQKRTISVPTLIMLRTTQSIPSLNFSTPLHSTSTLHAAGVPILVGTDANDDVAAPAKPAFGASIHEEMELLVRAGMSPLEVLRGATGRAAGVWGLHDRGVIEVGKRADLVLVRGDPMRNVSATREIRRVWVGGVEIEDEWRGRTEADALESDQTEWSTVDKLRSRYRPRDEVVWTSGADA
ncbi:hypothetical protein PRZ48_008135 [Zasmidium cellare]|uniref:Amidohydrolase-related domain-containing protein n=1 Tax=Zasmidium cellare TaxID=395010 RepID=A0ABR0EEZ6_ZASCE|nr:hypothetical protein PRZ48_008135 [Zasmidium cellare]